MTKRTNDATGSGKTRRDALKLGGGSALALLAALGSGSVAFARQATPAAGSVDGAYTVVRIRQVRADRDGQELLELIRDGYVPLAQEIPGFISYTHRDRRPGVTDPDLHRRVRRQGGD